MGGASLDKREKPCWVRCESGTGRLPPLQMLLLVSNGRYRFVFNEPRPVARGEFMVGFYSTLGARDCRQRYLEVVSCGLHREISAVP